MDNVTHTLTGLMLSRSGIDRKVARAAPMMMIAANLPDIDAVSFFGGPVAYLEWHRSYPHALVFAPLMALIPPLLFLVFARQRISLWAYAGSLIGVLSHLALDWTNMYGIRLLLPFSTRWQVRHWQRRFRPIGCRRARSAAWPAVILTGTTHRRGGSCPKF